MVKGYKDKIIDDIEVVEGRRCRQRFGIVVYKIARNVRLKMRREVIESRRVQTAEHGVVLGSIWLGLQEYTISLSCGEIHCLDVLLLRVYSVNLDNGHGVLRRTVSVSSSEVPEIHTWSK